jgi:hypothetical protein
MFDVSSAPRRMDPMSRPRAEACQPRLDDGTSTPGNRSCVVVLDAALLAAQKDTACLTVGTRRITDRQPLVTRHLAQGEPLQIVRHNDAPL